MFWKKEIVDAWGCKPVKEKDSESNRIDIEEIAKVRTATIQVNKPGLSAAEEMDLIEKRLMNKLPDEEARND